MAETNILKWHELSENLQLMLKNLYQDGRYSNINLVSDDQIQFKAHKMVLSACSPVFKKIIDNIPSEQPMIYLRGIQSSELESILQFMYLGEAKVFQERLRGFMRVAKDLEVKDISNGLEMDNEEEKTVDDETHLHFLCNQCNYKSKAKKDLQTHIQSKHEGIKYPCHHCDYEASRQDTLQTHIESQHEGIRYPCDQCGFQATRRDTLQKHIRSIHEGVKYPCNHCDYKASQRSSLRDHIAGKHSDNILKCDHCDHQTTWRQKHYKHKKTHVMPV